jgi:hypothetical protein
MNAPGPGTLVRPREPARAAAAPARHRRRPQRHPPRRRVRVWVVYLLHFDEPIGNLDSKTGYAQHYTGSTNNLRRRMREHETDSDVRIMEAVRQADIGWTLARTWPGNQQREFQLKKQGGAARRCPICKGQVPQLDAGGQEIEAAASALRAARRRALEPEPLENFIVSRLTPGETAELLLVLDEAHEKAWRLADPRTRDTGRFDLACELSGIRCQEMAAALRMDEAREIAAADEAAYQQAAARAPERDAPQPDQAPETARGEPEVRWTDMQLPRPPPSTTECKQPALAAAGAAR